MTDQTPHRPRNLAEMGQAMGKMFKPEDIGKGIAAYRPRPSDVIIAPFGKCGTTWLQQIFHTLRTGGDMDFDDISRVVPWIETSAMLGLDLEAPQRAEPRGFKSHLAHGAMPKGAKYIVAFRDPKDAFVSNYRFMEGWFFEPGSISISDFAPGWLDRAAQGQSYWSHLASWWAERNNPDVLLLSYAGMIAEPEAHIRKVAAFCGIALDDALLKLTLERSLIDYMLVHKDKFDDLMMRTLSETRCGLPPGSDSAKVRKGGVGGYKAELPDDIAEQLDAKWTEIAAPATGFADFAALDAALRST